MARSLLRHSPSEDIDHFLSQIQAASFDCTIYEYVSKAFQAAKDHRCKIGIDTELARSQRAYQSKYDPEDAELLEHGCDVYMGITNLKCRALQSWIHDIMLPANDRPWTLSPTPVPDLPPRLEEVVVQRLMLEYQAGGLSEEQFEDLAAEAKSIGLEEAKEIAEEAVGNMENKISDQLEQGKFRKSYDEFIIDLSVYPNAFVKGPVMRNKETLRWAGNRPVRANEMRLNVERLSPWDVYPSPNSQCPQSGNYITHIARMSQTELHACIGLYGFNEIAIRQLIADRPHGATGWMYRYENAIDDLHRTDSEANAPDHQYHCVVYYGKIPGRTLLDNGISVEDPHATVECEVWICDGQVLRAITNPYPLGRRPIYTTSYQKEPGQFWGRSLPSVLRDTQRVANAAGRALVKNMAFSSGPIGEYDMDRMVHEEEVTEVHPYRLIAVKADPFNGGTRAFNFQQIENVSHRLIQVYDRYTKEADEQSGIPAYAMGQPQTAGAGRTLGGLTLLMGNAAKGVKRVIGYSDIDVIEPMVEMYYMLNLIYSKDETIKADAQVMARGSTGLLQRELSQSRAIEVLQLLTPYTQIGLVPPESVLIVIRDVVASLGYSPDTLKIDDPKRLERLQLALAQVAAQANLAPGQVPAGISPAAPGTPLPDLDGRSQPPPDPTALEAASPAF